MSVLSVSISSSVGCSSRQKPIEGRPSRLPLGIWRGKLGERGTPAFESFCCGLKFE